MDAARSASAVPAGQAGHAGPDEPPDGPANGAGPGEASQPAPGTPGSPLKLTDPRMMRALAHPARIAILQHLAIEGPATATECAEVAGLSPSACSYHLRALARYGFVEEDPAAAVDGRQRPWRARIIAFSIESGPGVSTASRVASNVLRQSLQERFG